MRHVVDPVSAQRRTAVVADLADAAEISRDYVLLVMLSCVIGTFGLSLNSGAVIIGAMLIAPLMSPILAFALALVRSDLTQAARALGTLAAGALLAVALSAALGQVVEGSRWNFLAEAPAEVLSRTQPTLFDLAIALAGGTAAAYA